VVGVVTPDDDRRAALGAALEHAGLAWIAADAVAGGVFVLDRAGGAAPEPGVAATVWSIGPPLAGEAGSVPDLSADSLARLAAGVRSAWLAGAGRALLQLGTEDDGLRLESLEAELGRVLSQLAPPVLAWTLLLRDPGAGRLVTVARRGADAGFASRGELGEPEPGEARLPLGPEGQVGWLRTRGPGDGERAGELGHIAAALSVAAGRWSWLRRRQQRESELERAFLGRFQELQEANRRLQRLSRHKADFCRVCTEELGGPLSVVKGQAQLLQRGLLGETSDRQVLAAEAILRQGERMRGILDELLGGVAEAEEEAQRREDLDFGALLLAEGERLADSLGVAVDVRVDTSPTLVFGEADQLRPLIGALVHRAAEAITGGGQIVCRLGRSTSNSDLVLRVEHDGRSMQVTTVTGLMMTSQEDIERPQSLGWCRQVARYHGGRFTVEPMPMRGDRFVVTLPALPGGEAAGRRGRARILLLQPDEARRTAEHEALSRRFEADAEGTPSAAFGRLQATTYDAVVLGEGADQGEAGEQLLDELDADLELRGVPQVVRGDVGRVPAAAGRHFVSGMAGVDALLATVSQALGGRAGALLPRDAFVDRLERVMARAPDSWLPLSLLRVRAESGTLDLEGVARWLGPRTRSADMMGSGSPAELLVQLPGAPPHVPERLARGLAEAVDGGSRLADAALLFTWTSWEGGDDDAVDGERLLSCLDDPERRSSERGPRPRPPT